MELEYFYIANSAISNCIRNGEYNLNETTSIVTIRSPKDNSIIYTSFCLDTYLDQKDLMISDAIFTLTSSGYDHVDTQMIMKAISGQYDLRRTQDDEEIRDRIEKLKEAKITIQCKNEFVQKKIRSANNYTYKGNFLNCTPGHNFRYKNIQMPLYEYTQATRQIIAIPMELMSLCGKKPVNNSLDNLSIKYYLIRRLAISSYMSKGKSINDHSFMNNFIYERDSHRKGSKKAGMLYDLGLVEYKDTKDTKEQHENKSSNNKIKMRTHQIVKKYLDVFREIGFIDNYVTLKNGGRSITGVSIGSVESYKIFKGIDDTNFDSVIDVMDKVSVNSDIATKALVKFNHNIEDAAKYLKESQENKSKTGPYAILMKDVRALLKKLGSNLPDDLKGISEQKLMYEIRKRMTSVITEADPKDMNLVINMLVYTKLDANAAIQNLNIMKEKRISFTEFKKREQKK